MNTGTDHAGTAIVAANCDNDDCRAHLCRGPRLTSSMRFRSSENATAKLQATANVQDMSAGPAVIGPTMTLVSGKSTLLRLDEPIDRVSVGNPAVADVTIISPRELYLLGKIFRFDQCHSVEQGRADDRDRRRDQYRRGPATRQFALLLPGEKDIRVTAAADSVVLSGCDVQRHAGPAGGRDRRLFRAQHQQGTGASDRGGRRHG